MSIADFLIGLVMIIAGNILANRADALISQLQHRYKVKKDSHLSK